MHLLATTNGGLETITATELVDLVGAETAVHHRGVVEFEGNPGDVYDLHLRSRSCHRILEVLVDEPVDGLEDIYDHTCEADVASRLPFGTFGVESTRHGTHGFTSVDVADRVGQAVIDAYRATTGDRLPVDLDDPTVRLEAYLYDDRFTLAVDLTGGSLHRRPYRVCEHDSPLRGTLAWSMLRIADYEAGDALVDPMAGSATIPIEAALAARERPPRPDIEPAFAALPGYDLEAFRRRRVDHKTTSGDADAGLAIEARERRGRWRRCASRNREAAGLDAGDVAVVDADATEAAIEADCVVTNLPFGIRVDEDIRALYGAFADRVRAGGVDRFVALTTRPEFLPMEPVERYDIPYGRIDASVVRYDP